MSIQLDYHISIGVQNPSAMETRVAGVPIFQGELDLLQMSVVSDTTTTESGSPVTIKRSVVVTGGDALFPTNTDKIAALRGFYTGSLALGVPAMVTADEPIVV